MNFVTLETIKINDWLIKASVFDDQILIFFHNYNTMITYSRIFYDEETAHKFIENLYRCQDEQRSR